MKNENLNSSAVEFGINFQITRMVCLSCPQYNSDDSMTVKLIEVDKSNWLACTQPQAGDQQKATLPVSVMY